MFKIKKKVLNWKYVIKFETFDYWLKHILTHPHVFDLYISYTDEIVFETKIQDSSLFGVEQRKINIYPVSKALFSVHFYL